jgi:DNA-directed RNA polymerase specialized sigma24 family protein
MSPSQPPPGLPSGPPTRLPPLTHTTVDGRLFVRPAKVEAEILDALDRDPATWAKLASPRHKDGGLGGEAIVNLIRRLRVQPSRQRLVGDLVLVLDQRVCGLVARWAKGFDTVTQEEIAIEVGQAIVELVLERSPSAAGEFLEVQFHSSVQHRILNAVQKRKPAAEDRLAGDKKTRKRKQRIDYDVNKNDEEPAPLEPGDPEDALSILVEREVVPAKDRIRAALRHVSDRRHREAVVLHHLEGWPITDPDPKTATLCAYFDVSDRQIRNWIRTAFAEMRDALGEES